MPSRIPLNRRTPTIFQPARSAIWFTVLASLSLTPVEAATVTNNFVAGQFHELNDNGAWSWFMDERLMVDNGRLIVGSVRASGRYEQANLPGWGNIELAILDLASGGKRTVVLHEKFEQDDHNNPGLLKLADGRYLAAYSKHGQETKLYLRRSLRPGDPYEWGPVQEIITPGVGGSFRGDSVTYANPFRLTHEHGRLYLFHRGFALDPNYFVSEDDGQTWRYGGHLYIGRDGYAPYTKYVSNGRDTIHFVATEDHPRNFDNSLYHGFIRGGQVFGSDGEPMGPLPVGTNTSFRAWNFTRVFQGGPTNVAWMSDIHLDRDERPVILFTTQRDGAGQPMGAGGMDHRFHYARWDGAKWVTHEIAHAGTRLYPGEDDYTGLGAIDPQNPNVVYISTDADPVTGRPLISRASYRRFHELFRGETADGGATWQWTAITSNSSMDNLRPLVPIWPDANGRTAVVWMRGGYRVNRGEWTTAVAATILPAPK
ncbi:MAG TPA: BNR-4 repeat-containing protein [Verrucomicrobiae bacterium]|nr:BNR-4 repeat-containing protein [Verrucomicrobiae bacterium]